jgi:membrane protein YdbS with pleckstrin-like domain
MHPGERAEITRKATRDFAIYLFLAVIVAAAFVAGLACIWANVSSWLAVTLLVLVLLACLYQMFVFQGRRP